MVPREEPRKIFTSFILRGRSPRYAKRGFVAFPQACGTSASQNHYVLYVRMSPNLQKPVPPRGTPPCLRLRHSRWRAGNLNLGLKSPLSPACHRLCPHQEPRKQYSLRSY